MPHAKLLVQLPSALPPSQGLPEKQKVFLSNDPVSVPGTAGKGNLELPVPAHCSVAPRQGRDRCRRSAAPLLHFTAFLPQVMAMSASFLHRLKSQE